MMRLTAKALMTNFNATYLVSFFLALLTVVAVIVPTERVPLSNLLTALGLVAALALGLLAGTTLTEIKVKPLSFVMPGQERSLAPAVLLVGLSTPLIYAVLVYLKPLSVTDVAPLQQAVTIFAYCFALYLLVVALCLVTRDTAFTSLATAAPFVLVMGSLGQPQLAELWVAITLAMVRTPVIAVACAITAAAVIWHLLGDRGRSRTTCGAPFVPLKAYDNPFKVDEIKRMNAGVFRPSFITSSGPSPTALLITALTRKLPGTPWDSLVQDPRLSGNAWDFLFRLATLIVIFSLIVVMVSAKRAVSGLGLHFLLVGFTFMFFAPTFSAHLSPMLPVSRRQHFQSFVTKAVSVYVAAMAGLLLLKLVLALFADANGTSLQASIDAAARLPVRGVILAAGAVPILSFAFATFRSTFGFLLFMMLFFGGLMNLTLFAERALLQLATPLFAGIMAGIWLPFLLIAWKRCIRDDLLRL